MRTCNKMAAGVKHRRKMENPVNAGVDKWRWYEPLGALSVMFILLPVSGEQRYELRGERRSNEVRSAGRGHVRPADPVSYKYI